MQNWDKCSAIGLISEFTKKTRADWTHIFEINVFGLMELNREAYKRMAISCGGKGGSIVNLSSQVARFGGKNIAYSASKGAVNSFTVALAKEIGHENIRVNAVSPGGIEGPIAGSKEEQDETFKINYINKTPLKRMTEPLDVANAVVFLCSENSSYITGHILNVDGGISSV